MLLTTTRRSLAMEDSLQARLARTGLEYDAYTAGAPRPDWLTEEEWAERVLIFARIDAMYSDLERAAAAAEAGRDPLL